MCSSDLAGRDRAQIYMNALQRTAVDGDMNVARFGRSDALRTAFDQESRPQSPYRIERITGE